MTLDMHALDGTGDYPVIDDTFVDAGTHRLHVVVARADSEYTIVLEVGGGQSAEAFRDIQETLARQTGVNVMCYDRSGFGQSELGPDTFTAIDEVDTLKRCLDSLGFRDRLILAGLSYGGFLIQLFAQRYPQLVKGLVLIDPMNVRFVDRFGLDRLNAVTPYNPNPVETYEKAGKRMVDFFPQALAALRGKELPPEIPAILITAGIPPLNEDVWRACHEEMMAHSDRHRLLVAEGSHHDIVAEDPALVVRAVSEMFNLVKATQS